MARGWRSARAVNWRLPCFDSMTGEDRPLYQDRNDAPASMIRRSARDVERTTGTLQAQSPPRRRAPSFETSPACRLTIPILTCAGTKGNQKASLSPLRSRTQWVGGTRRSTRSTPPSPRSWPSTCTPRSTYQTKTIRTTTHWPPYPNTSSKPIIMPMPMPIITSTNRPNRYPPPVGYPPSPSRPGARHPSRTTSERPAWQPAAAYRRTRSRRPCPTGPRCAAAASAAAATAWPRPSTTSSTTCCTRTASSTISRSRCCSAASPSSSPRWPRWRARSG